MKVIFGCIFAFLLILVIYKAICRYRCKTSVQEIHESMVRQYSIRHGSFDEELPEQLLILEHVKPTANVLELGGNIGRSSLAISFKLRNSQTLVVLESDKDNARKLKENKDINNLDFHIESAALSHVPLIQKEWVTKPGTSEENGWRRVTTTTFNDLQTKYGIQFDTFVIDCECCFLPILQQNDHILENINTIILENDCDAKGNREIQKILCKNRFSKIVCQPHGDNSCFFSVWKR